MTEEVNHLDHWISEKPAIKKHLQDNPALARLLASTEPPKASWNEAEWKKITASYKKSTS